MPRSAAAGPVSAGNGFTVVAMPDRTVAVWSANGSRPLGLGDTQPRAVPTAVPGLTDIVAVAAAGAHTMALTSGGLIYAFRSNPSRQVDNNSPTNATSPVLLGLTGIVAIAAGDAYSVALANDGNVWAASGGSHSLVLLADGTVRVRLQPVGQVGDSSTTKRTSLVAVTGLRSVATIVAGANHSGAIRSDGTLRVWGLGTNEQIGDSLTTNRLTATAPVAPATGSATRSSATAPPRASLRPTRSAGRITTGKSARRRSTRSPAPTPSRRAWSSATRRRAPTIHYKLNGDDPTERDPVVASGSTVLIDENRTLKARAWNGAMPASNIATAIYALQVPTPMSSPTPTHLHDAIER